MSTKKPRKVHRDMPEDARQLAKAMFNAADGKLKKGRATEKKPAAQGR